MISYSHAVKEAAKAANNAPASLRFSSDKDALVAIVYDMAVECDRLRGCIIDNAARVVRDVANLGAKAARGEALYSTAPLANSSAARELDQDVCALWRAEPLFFRTYGAVFGVAAAKALSAEIAAEQAK